MKFDFKYYLHICEVLESGKLDAFYTVVKTGKHAVERGMELAKEQFIECSMEYCSDYGERSAHTH